MNLHNMMKEVRRLLKTEGKAAAAAFLMDVLGIELDVESGFPTNIEGLILAKHIIASYDDEGNVLDELTGEKADDSALQKEYVIQVGRGYVIWDKLAGRYIEGIWDHEEEAEDYLNECFRLGKTPGWEPHPNSNKEEVPKWATDHVGYSVVEFERPCGPSYFLVADPNGDYVQMPFSEKRYAINYINNCFKYGKTPGWDVETH